MFKINPGEFRHPITIQRYTEGTNEDGMPSKEWKDLFPTKAKINNTTGKEYINANGDISLIQSKFTIRASRTYNITPKDRIIYNNTIYNIKHTNNIFENNIYLEIVGELVE